MEIPYDINFPCPLPDTLESPLVKLVPFIPDKYMQHLFDATNPKDHPDLFEYFAFPFGTVEEIRDFVEWVRSDPEALLLAIIDKTTTKIDDSTTGGSLAGVIGLIHTSEQNLSTEIGPVIVAPKFQGTHVSSHAIGLLLRYCFELPSSGGLGFRRVQWTSNPANVASIRAAEKMGFVVEGILRWTWVLPIGKMGRRSREGDPMSGLGRDSTLLAVCWDDWEARVREQIFKKLTESNTVRSQDCHNR